MRVNMCVCERDMFCLRTLSVDNILWRRW